MEATRYATAHEAFEARKSEIDLKLERLRAALEAKPQSEAASPSDWGHAGDLAHVDDLLGQALSFITNGREG
ncbi:MAG: hypothetical protein Q7U80_04545 [Thiobacillus sp.]|nr:hypothetical protein [Thiobacillus sp.]MDP3125597.1 hypothetical protein [Thiobacillus sp.]